MKGCSNYAMPVGFMELQGAEYLFNLSGLGLTFAAVSVLVMLVRQSWGSRLSNFDVHLLVSYISGGFAVAVGAVLPALAAQFSEQTSAWRLSAIPGALLIGWFVGSVISRRRQVGARKFPVLVWVDMSLYTFAAGLLVASLFAPAAFAPGLYCLAFTIMLAVVMWSFLRRIASLLGETSGDDWDPRRG
ncbi:MAG: hypothetical protein E5W38_10175 [Mesorhizobium sp.]|nr:MAG: hypothetical protein E5W38_10175 [Mesorhizobium sp.]